MLAVYFIVAANIEGNNALILYDQLKGYSIPDIDGHRMKFTQRAFEPMQSQGRVVRVQLQKLEGFFVLRKKVRMPFQETGGPFVIGRGVKNPKTHDQSFLIRSMCSSTLSSTAFPSAISCLA
jgi:hypothetical protein